MRRKRSAVDGSQRQGAARANLQFCAAKLTHEAISANPQNIVNCPYVVYVYELTAIATHIHIGYRQPLAGASKISRKAVANIDALLNEIITEVAE